MGGQVVDALVKSGVTYFKLRFTCEWNGILADAVDYECFSNTQLCEMFNLVCDSSHLDRRYVSFWHQGRWLDGSDTGEAAGVGHGTLVTVRMGVVGIKFRLTGHQERVLVSVSIDSQLRHLFDEYCQSQGVDW